MPLRSGIKKEFGFVAKKRRINQPFAGLLPFFSWRFPNNLKFSSGSTKKRNFAVDR